MPRQNILIVDDDLPIATMYEFKLKQCGYLVRSAYDGKEGFRIARDVVPAVLLLDLKMPVMSGEEMLTLVRAEKWGKNIRVIILTNLSKDEAPSVLRFLKVDHYIVKAHHTPSQVVKIVEEVLDLPKPK